MLLFSRFNEIHSPQFFFRHNEISTTKRDIVGSLAISASIKFSLYSFFLKLRLFYQQKGCRSSRPEVFCTDLRPAVSLKKRLWHRCFPVNFVKFLRTPFFIEHLRWLLLGIIICDQISLFLCNQ